MKITFKDIAEQAEYEGYHLLALKCEFKRLRNRGTLFFQGDITMMDWDSALEIYYYLMPPRKSKVDAFPILKKNFFKKGIKNKEDLKFHFQKYYDQSMWTENLYESYKKNQPFIGEEYVWYYI